MNLNKGDSNQNIIKPKDFKTCSCNVNPQNCSSKNHNCICNNDNCTISIFCKIHKPYQFNNLYKSSYLIDF